MASSRPLRRTGVAVTGRELARRLGPVGLWTTHLHYQPMSQARESVAWLERLGFGAVWVGEATSKPALIHSALLLGGGDRIVIATGIASIWAQDPMMAANAGRTLNEAYPGRFVLGLGVSHPFLTEPRGREYRKPLEHMRWYLDTMDRAPWFGLDVEPAPRVLAALGPKMLELAGERAAGAHPYFVPVEHTARAREILGPEPLLAPEQAVTLELDPEAARRIARRYMKGYLELPNYTSNLTRLGWMDDDLAGSGSDRLLDAMVAWGGVETVRARLDQHRQAGADHVAIRVLTEDPRRFPEKELEELAAALI
jgi:probable F420-dependent oxidoreductase